MKLDTFGLFVKDVPTMVAFYSNMMGMKIGYDGGEAHADVIEPKTGFRLMLSSRTFAEKLLGQKSVDEKVNPRSELAFLVSSYDEVDNKFAKFKTAGIKIISEPATFPWGQRNFYFTDPEGNLIEIFANEA